MSGWLTAGQGGERVRGRGPGAGLACCQCVRGGLQACARAVSAYGAEGAGAHRAGKHSAHVVQLHGGKQQALVRPTWKERMTLMGAPMLLLNSSLI